MRASILRVPPSGCLCLTPSVTRLTDHRFTGCRYKAFDQPCIYRIQTGSIESNSIYAGELPAARPMSRTLHRSPSSACQSRRLVRSVLRSTNSNWVGSSVHIAGDQGWVQGEAQDRRHSRIGASRSSCAAVTGESCPSVNRNCSVGRRPIAREHHAKAVRNERHVSGLERTLATSNRPRIPLPWSISSKLTRSGGLASAVHRPFSRGPLCVTPLAFWLAITSLM